MWDTAERNMQYGRSTGKVSIMHIAMHNLAKADAACASAITWYTVCQIVCIPATAADVLRCTMLYMLPQKAPSCCLCADMYHRYTPSGRCPQHCQQTSLCPACSNTAFPVHSRGNNQWPADCTGMIHDVVCITYNSAQVQLNADCASCHASETQFCFSS